MSRVLLIKNANLYDPDPKGIRDILIVDEKVFSVAEHIDPPELSAPVEVVSADGKMVIPGYVDQHVHVIGGGGAKLLVTRLSSLHEEVRDAVKAGVPVEKAIRICGENPARANGLFPKKGCIRPGSDADLVILDEEFLVDTVFVRGQKMVEYGRDRRIDIMIKLLKNANVYAPEKLGKKDILIEGEKILLMQDTIEGYEGLPGVETYDLEGKTVVPAYIDMHVHITGGGGEQGPASRVPESQLSEFFKNGITTVVGLLGTDGVTRSVENLVAKARALTEEGMTVYTLTSSYGYPPTTLTGSVERDIILVPPMIGVKVAVSDHRSSNPGGEELIALATAARRAGLLSNTPGLVTMHMGDGEGRLDPIFYVLDHSDVPAKNLLPTHILRNPGLIDAGADLVRRGGYIDCTAGADDVEVESDALKLYELLHREDVSLDHVTMSSDAFGSQPRFNEEGECIGLTYASPKYLHRTIQILVREGMPLEDALQLLTSTPAVLLGKEGIKGCVAEGADADLLVLDENLNINSLFARGKVAVWEQEVKMKGRFEQ